jgi:hypothetical protein
MRLIVLILKIQYILTMAAGATEIADSTEEDTEPTAMPNALLAIDS